MNSYLANFINSVTLMGMGLWGYFESSSVTALIPVLFGFILNFDINSNLNFITAESVSLALSPRPIIFPRKIKTSSSNT